MKKIFMLVGRETKVVTVAFMSFVMVLLCAATSRAQVSFLAGRTQSITVCREVSTSIVSELSVNEAMPIVVTWSVQTGPSHGNLGGFPSATTSAGGVTSSVSSLTYTGDAGYTGLDTFQILVVDAMGNRDSTEVAVTVLGAPTVGSFSGGTTVCVGSTLSLFVSGDAGGVWSSTNTSLATVDPSSGVVTGVATGGGLLYIRYKVTNACDSSIDSVSITVDPAVDPGVLSASATNVCVGSSISSSSTVIGGTFTSSDASIATVDAALGDITGVSVGTVVITYTVTSGSCTPAFDTVSITVDPAGSAGTITTADDTLCVSGTSTYTTSGSAGGTWSSSDVSIATVDPTTGVVTGVAAGVADISYTLSTCGSASASLPVTINGATDPGTISGSHGVCEGFNYTYTNATAVGTLTWSSSNTSVATIGGTSGILTAVTSGFTIITSTATTSCGTATDTQMVNVGTFPTAGTITGAGGRSRLCTSSSTLDTLRLTSTVTGGTWSTSDASLATVTSDGLVTAVAYGTPFIMYTVTTACSADVATYNLIIDDTIATPEISGATSLCHPTISFYSSSATGGSWSTSSASVGTINASGMLTTVSVGTTIVSYSVTGFCNTATDTMEVTISTTASAGTISGSDTVCFGSGDNYTSTGTAGGAWTVSDGSIASIGVFSGALTARTVGSVTITYTVNSTCGSDFATKNIIIPSVDAGTISGATTLCNGTTSTLTSSVTGGVWSSTNTSVATISTSGDVTAVGTGTTTIIYILSTGLCSDSSFRSITVSDAPSLGAITGTTTICEGASTTLTNATTGGTWSSSNDLEASVDGSGVVLGVSAGTPTISYIVSIGSCADTATIGMTIGTAPFAGTISGAASLCSGTSATFTATGTGGTWSTSDAGVASVSTGGDVTAVAAGSATISYIVTSGSCADTATQGVAVNNAPVLGAISGTTTICQGATTTLTNATTGGTWSSSNTAEATVDGAGVVTGVSAGTPTISYIVSIGSCADTATTSMTINAAPTAGTITGTATLCAGTSSTFTTTGTGGTWSTSDAGVASVSTGGDVTAVAAGSATISYIVTSGSCADTATQGVAVNNAPVLGAISGTTTICQGATTTLTNATTGGTWSSSNTSQATVDGAGVVTGVSAGTPTISYIVSIGSCADTATTSMTINALPSAGTITGTATLCAGTSSTFTTTGTGGTWSTSDASIASVDGSGLVSAVAAGSATISYTVTSGSCADTATQGVAVNNAPVLGAISGTTTICQGATTTLTNATTGGTWSSSNTAEATVDGAGVVTGVSAGTPTISYIVSIGSCADTATTSMTINAAPTAGTITGTATLCAGTSATFTTSGTGGTWSTSDAGVASVSIGGDVTAVAAGSATISYIVTSGSCADTATQGVAVNNAPVLGAISGTTTICQGATTTLTNATTGGTWSSSNTAEATVDGAGVVTGVSAGTPTISYIVSIGSCADTVTTSMTINAAPTAGTITGTATLCAGTSSTFTTTGTGGTWSTSDASIASVDGSGLVSAVATGSATISYIVTSGSCADTATQGVAVNNAPVLGAISGTTTICQGATTTLTNATTGGTWSSSNTAEATVDGAGVVTGVSAGTPTISYIVSIGSCADTVTTSMTINAAPTAGTISGGSSTCIGASVTLTSTVSGGTWGTSDASIASVDASGNVTGVAAGSVDINYIVTSGSCSDTAIQNFSVNTSTSAGTISGTTTVCIGATTTLTSTVTGGTWSSSNTAEATVDASGVVTGVTGGTPTISYIVGSGSCADTATQVVTVTSTPSAGTISGGAATCVGSSITLSSTVTGGTWTTSDGSIASVDASGVVSGVAAGSATITYTITSGSCTGTSTQPITVNNALSAGTISGAGPLCVAATLTLSSTVTGGSWTTDNAAIASVDASGVVTGVAIGSTNITYTVSATGCTSATAGQAITVSPAGSAGTITGADTICVAATTTLTSTVTGGTWSSSNNAIATVVAGSGLVRGVASGSVVISYTVVSACGTSVATRSIFINTTNPGTISGPSSVCVGANITLTSTVTGGTWSSSNTALATAGAASGIIGGISAGTPSISYSFTGSCGTAITTYAMTVNALPSLTAITGAATVCTGQTITLANSTTGGTWSTTTTTIATVSATGVLTGVAAGTSVVTYTVTGGTGCTNFTTRNTTVSASPTVGAISGATNICIASSTTLTNSVAGGTWASSNGTIAFIVAASGNVTGLTAGTVTISYSRTAGACTSRAFATLTVDPLPTISAITGTTTVCQYRTTTLSNATTGGSWASATPAVATVSATGVVTGVTAGTALISYTISSGACSRTTTATVTVNSTPSVLPITTSGGTSLCTGFTTTLADATTGGVWSSNDTNIARISATGVVTAGATAGTATISYTVTTGACPNSALQAIVVNTPPTIAPISGPATVCLGNFIGLTTTTTGGVWSNLHTSITTVDAGGTVTGVSLGVDTIIYTLTSGAGCINADSFTVTVTPLPNAGVVSGTDTFCQGTTSALSSTVSGGTWSSSNAGIATVNASGVVTGVAGGTANITYTFTNSCGSDDAIFPIVINGLPAVSTIGGPTTYCIGATGTMTNTFTGGTWGTSDASIAAISATGVVTANAVGTATITYSGTNGCGTVDSTISIVIDSIPDAGTISGGTTVCAGSTLALSNTVTTGTWSTSDATVATIDAAGLVTGVAAGSVTVSYSVTNSCTTTNATFNVTVNDVPSVAGITGPTIICLASPASLANTTTGGVWASADNTIATIDASTGLVTAVSIGAVNMSYTVTNACGVTTVLYGINTLDLPVVAAITGTDSTCVGNTVTLSSTTTGGAWTSSNAAIAAVDAAGNVTANSLGTATISYSLSNACGSTDQTLTFRSLDLPVLSAITGSSVVCVGASTLLSNSTPGGTWSTDDATVATMDAAGNAYGVGTGLCNVIYDVTNACGTSTEIFSLTTDDVPVVGSTTSSSPLCVGSATTFFNSTFGGVWSSSDGSIATIDTTTGDITPVSAGTVNISYTLSNACGSSSDVTGITVIATPIPGPITGTTTFCAGTTSTLVDANPGGTWSSTTTSVATVNTTGTVTGVGAGTSLISYSVVNFCGSVLDTVTVTINDVPTPTAITGGTAVCATSTLSLSNTTTGGTWSSSDDAIATVDASGVVTGVTAGSVTITYAVTNGCGVTNNVLNVTVNPLPFAGTISGTADICVSSTSALSTSGSTGGTWSSASTAIATVSTAGVVTAVTAGSTTITYNLTNVCGTDIATYTVNTFVIPSVPAIGGSTSVCVAATTTLSNTTTGGTWSSSDASIATIDATTGVVTGVTAGSATISYAVTNVCGTTTVTLAFTVNPLPDTGTITGTFTVCAGLSTVVGNTATGGTWSSTNTGVATIDATGLVTGVAAGTTTISYAVTNGCGTLAATQLFTVTDVPVVPAIAGTLFTCPSGSETLTNDTTGGTWSSSDASIATVDGTTGVVTGVTAGLVDISYTVTNSCGSTTVTTPFTVNPVPSAGSITGTTTVCAGSTTTLSNSVAGGTWSSSDVSVATVDAAGVVTGVSAGVINITYSVTNSCGTADSITSYTVNDVPPLGAITGPTEVCVGSTIAISSTLFGGTWVSSNTSVATVDAAGVVTGVAVGTATMSYSLSNSCGTATVTSTITVNDVPVVSPITGTTTVCPTGTSTLTSATTGGTWASSDVTIATVDATGTVTGVATTGGTATITYNVTTACGSTDVTTTFTVTPYADAGVITGTPSVCTGGTTTLASTTTGGTWSSSDASVATVDATGVVTGVAVGSVDITYSYTNACGTSDSVLAVSVITVPSVGTITGSTAMCVGASNTFSNTTTGGVWTSTDTTVASINSSTGVAFGVATGAATISYTVTNACGATTVTTTATVSAPPTAATVTGTDSVCAGSSITLSASTTGGRWTSADASVVTVDTLSGVVTGVGAGTTTISYTLTNSCGAATATYTVRGLDRPTVAAITGTTTICQGITVTLSDATAGGTWSSTNTAVATISTAGVAYGVAPGSATISYSVTNSCGTTASTRSFVVNALPTVSAITGPTSVCRGSAITLADTTAGGSWTSSNITLATVDASGVVTGVSAGTVNITYSIINSLGCIGDAVAAITVVNAPTLGAITGSSTVYLGFNTTLSNSTTGGTWSSSDTTIASINASGVVTGRALGTAVITYSVTSSGGCTVIATHNITVINTAIAFAILHTDTTSSVPSSSPRATVCNGYPVTMFVNTTASTAGFTYQWFIDGTPIAGATNYIYATDSVGYYTVSVNTGSGTILVSGLTLQNTPHPTISVLGTNLLYTGSFATYQWLLNGTPIAGATSSVYTATIYGDYSVIVTDGNHCEDTSDIFIYRNTSSVKDVDMSTIKLYPNPASSIITIDAPVAVNVTLMSMDGKVVIKANEAKTIEVGSLANGMYMIMIYDEQNHLLRTDKFMKVD